MIFSEAIREYLRWQRIDKEYSPHTVAARDANLSIILRHIGDIELEKIDETVISELREWLHTCIAKQTKKPISGFTRHKRLSDLHEFLKFCASKGWKTFDWRKLELPKMGEPNKQWLAPNDIEKLIAGISDETLIGLRDRAIIAVLSSSGMRIGELLRLTRNSFDGEGRTSVIGKGNKRRPVYLTREAQKLLSAYLEARDDERDELFVGYKRLAAGGRTNRRWKYKPTGFGAGAAHTMIKVHALRILNKRGIGCHTMRHSFATNLLNRGCDVRNVQLLMGHSQLSSTERYTHYVDARLYDLFQSYAEKVETRILEKKRDGKPVVKITIQTWEGEPLDLLTVDKFCEMLGLSKEP